MRILRLPGGNRTVFDVYGHHMGIIEHDKQGWRFEPIIGSHLYEYRNEYWLAVRDARSYEFEYVIPTPPGRIAQ